MTIAKLGMSKGKYKVPNKGVFIVPSAKVNSINAFFSEISLFKFVF